MLRGPAFLSNMIIATTPIVGGLVAIIYFGLRNAFPLLDVSTWLSGSLLFALPEEFPDCVFLLEPLFFAFACTSGSGAVPNGR